MHESLPPSECASDHDDFGHVVTPRVTTESISVEDVCQFWIFRGAHYRKPKSLVLVWVLFV